MALVSRRLLAATQRLGASSDGAIEKFQLERLNSIWTRAVGEIPYYVDLVRQGTPRSFRSIAEFIDTVPILTKSMFREDYSRFSYQHPAPNAYRITGGSTSVPIQIPTWKKEFDASRLDPWVGRSWYGIEPSDRLFLYWGHAHLLGTGYRRALNVTIRRIKDRVQNYQRHSCYDMSPPAIMNAVEALRRSNADFVIGYSSSLDRLARHCRSEGIRLDSLGLKAVIATAEAFPQDDSAIVVSEVFGAPVGMEYGAVETSLIAHTTSSGGFRVFWWNQLMENDGAGVQPVRVTSLYNRCMPLFRYEVGDLYQSGRDLRRTPEGSVIEFSNVVGRLNARIPLPSGRDIHSEAVTHIVRHLSAVSGFQLVVSADQIHLRLISERPLAPEDIAVIKSRAFQIDREFGELLQVVFVEQLEQTVAGKSPMVLQRPTLQPSDAKVHPIDQSQ